MLFPEVDYPASFLVLTTCHYSWQTSTVTERSSNINPVLHFKYCGTCFDICFLAWWTLEGQMGFKLSLHETHLYSENEDDLKLTSIFAWNRVEAEKVGCQKRIHSSKDVSQYSLEDLDECVRTPNTRFLKCLWAIQAMDLDLPVYFYLLFFSEERSCLLGIFCYLVFPGWRGTTTKQNTSGTQYRGFSLLVLVWILWRI